MGVAAVKMRKKIITRQEAKELEDEKKEAERYRKTGLEQLKRQAEANGYILTKKGD